MRQPSSVLLSKCGDPRELTQSGQPPSPVLPKRFTFRHSTTGHCALTNSASKHCCSFILKKHRSRSLQDQRRVAVSASYEHCASYTEPSSSCSSSSTSGGQRSFTKSHATVPNTNVASAKRHKIHVLERRCCSA